MYEAYTALGEKIHNKLPEVLLRIPDVPYRYIRKSSFFNLQEKQLCKSLKELFFLGL